MTTTPGPMETLTYCSSGISREVSGRRLKALPNHATHTSLFGGRGGIAQSWLSLDTLGCLERPMIGQHYLCYYSVGSRALHTQKPVECAAFCIPGCAVNLCMVNLVWHCIKARGADAVLVATQSEPAKPGLFWFRLGIVGLQRSMVNDIWGARITSSSPTVPLPDVPLSPFSFGVILPCRRVRGPLR